MSDVMGVQRLPVGKKFQETCSIGSGGKVSEHVVRTCGLSEKTLSSSGNGVALSPEILSQFHFHQRCCFEWHRV